MGETYEEVNGSSHGIVVIWLDAHIGAPDCYQRLKAAFSSNIDPTNLKPVELISQYGNDTLPRDSYLAYSRRVGIPCELRTFMDSESCLQYIRESLDANKRIYLITSDYVGSTLLPHITQQYPEVFRDTKARISFYILRFDILHSLEWLHDYIDCALVFEHEVDLLWRLVHDIAMYYAKIGRKLLSRNVLVDTHQALIYFEWANVLCHHERRITDYQDSKFIEDLEYLINQAEEKIKHNMNSTRNKQYSQGDMQRSLESSIFIYYSKEFSNEAAQLLSMLQNLTNEQGTLFHNCDAYIVRLQSESHLIKQHCPIVISSNKDDRMKVLKELSSLASVNHIYLLDPDEHISIPGDEHTLLESFPKLRDIYADVEILALEWTAERSSICEKIGATCTENRDLDTARMYYAKAIKLNKHLSTSIKNN